MCTEIKELPISTTWNAWGQLDHEFTATRELHTIPRI